jgi:hypothetical protein
VEGVYEVINHLKVNLRGADRREDDEIRGAALQNLIWDAEAASDSSRNDASASPVLRQPYQSQRDL